MKATPFGERLHQLEEQQVAIKHVLRRAWMPSIAVSECSERLRSIAQGLEELASDIEEAQRGAALQERRSPSHE
jgi:hypothetical protein